MGALTAALLAGALSVAPATPASVTRWTPYIEEAARRFGVPADWIARVMRAESGGMTMLDGHPIRSRAGAMGLMQLMPATWAEMRDAHDLGANPDDPHANILAGTAYLRLLFDRFGYPGLFAAYNAGPARYADYLRGAQPLPRETLTYWRRVVGRSERPQGKSDLAPPPLFVIRKGGVDGASAMPAGAENVGPGSPDPMSIFVPVATSQ